MRQERLRSAILSAVAADPPVHVVELAAELDEHPVTVDQACARLQKAGCIRLTSHSLYELTEEGRRRVDEPERKRHA